jgi:hypothetical protein
MDVNGRLGTAIVAALALLSPAAGAAPPAPAAADGAEACAADGNVAYVCGIPHPEDFVAAPGRDLVIAGSFGMPRLTAVDPRTKRTRLIYPSGAPPQFDRAAYPACPGPLPVNDLAPHGVAARADGTDTILYVVSHGRREAIEIFRIGAQADAPAVWIGCVPAPEGVTANGVAPLADGGVAITNFGTVNAEVLARIVRGEPTGEVREWHADGGWRILPGSEMSGANGIETASNPDYLYVASSGSRKVVRLDRTGKTPAVDLPLDFFPDNIHRAPDGRLIIAGTPQPTDVYMKCAQTDGCYAPFRVTALDPETMTLSTLTTVQPTPIFGTVSSASIVGTSIWAGSHRGSRLAIVPLP